MGIQTIISIISASIAVLSIALSIITFMVSNKRDSYMTIDSIYSSLLEKGINNPSLRDPSKTVNYDKYDKNNPKEREYFLSYSTYAYMIWNFIETIYDLHQRSRKNSYMIETWMPVIIDENKLHFRWFKNNQRLFKKEFREFVLEEVNKIKIIKGTLDDFRKVYYYMEDEFPIEERKDKQQLIKLLASAKYNLYLFKFDLSNSDDDSFIGYAFGCENDDHSLFWLDYINILPSYQSCGYGSICLKLLRDFVLDEKNGRGILFEIEKPDDGTAGVKTRRRNFYLRLGASKLDVPYVLPTKDGGGVELDLMFYPNHEIDFVSKDELKVMINDSVKLIHSDYPTTESVIAKYIEDVPDFIKEENIEIHRGDINDLEFIHKHVESSFPEFYQMKKEVMEEYLKNPDYQLLLLKNRYQDIVAYSFTYLCKDHDFVFIDYLAVNPFFRNAGYGTRFLSLLNTHAKNLSKYGVIFEMLPKDMDNGVSEKFTKKFGGYVLNVDYRFPAKDKKIPTKIGFIPNPDTKYISSSDIKEALSDVLLTLHSDTVSKTNLREYLKEIHHFER